MILGNFLLPPKNRISNPKMPLHGQNSSSGISFLSCILLHKSPHPTCIRKTRNSLNFLRFKFIHTSTYLPPLFHYLHLRIQLYKVYNPIHQTVCLGAVRHNGRHSKLPAASSSTSISFFSSSVPAYSLGYTRHKPACCQYPSSHTNP